MKKTLYYIILVVVVTIISVSINPIKADAAARAVTVTLNGGKINFPDAQPFIDKQGRIQVPIRYIGEALQISVDYSTKNGARTAVFSNKTTKVEFVLNTSTYYVNNIKHDMDTKSQVVQDRTFTPARYLAEQFGASVNWNAKSYTVEIFQSQIASPIVQLPSPTTASASFNYVDDKSALQQYQTLAIALLKNNSAYMSNRDQGIKYYELIISPLYTDKTELAKRVASYKMKSTAADYHWKTGDVQSFAKALQTLSANSQLTTQVFHATGEKVLSYRHIVNVNGVPIWLEVQLTFNQVKDTNYKLVDIKA